MILFSFDRDGTVDCGSPPGPVPAVILKALRAAGHLVYVHGNQELCRETGSLGMQDARDHWLAVHGPLPAYFDDSRSARLLLLGELHPDIELLRICVDDVDLYHLEPESWIWFSPRAFMLSQFAPPLAD